MVDMTHLETKWEKKISEATADTSFNQIGYSFLVLAFTIVFREGVESVILITGVGAADPISLVIPGILGIIVVKTNKIIKKLTIKIGNHNRIHNLSHNRKNQHESLPSLINHHHPHNIRWNRVECSS